MDALAQALSELPPVSRILKGRLYLGGCHAPGAMQKKPRLHVACAEERPPDPASAAEVIFFPLDDDPETDWLSRPLWVRQVMKVGAVVGESIRKGRTLVTCACGVNRSGLVAALGLCRFGVPPDDAIRLLRSMRSPLVLFNREFVKVVRSVGPRMAEF